MKNSRWFNINFFCAVLKRLISCIAIKTPQFFSYYFVFFSIVSKILTTKTISFSIFIFSAMFYNHGNTFLRTLQRSCEIITVNYFHVFPKFLYHSYNLLQWMFFILCDNWQQYFLHKFIVTKRLGATAMLLHSLKQVFWKKPTFYVLCFLHNNIAMMLMPKVQSKATF